MVLVKRLLGVCIGGIVMTGEAVAPVFVRERAFVLTLLAAGPCDNEPVALDAVEALSRVRRRCRADFIAADGSQRRVASGREMRSP